MQSMWIEPILTVFLGYMLGSIPFGLLLTRLTGGGDLREIGSGNIGATTTSFKNKEKKQTTTENISVSCTDKVLTENKQSILMSIYTCFYVPPYLR